MVTDADAMMTSMLSNKVYSGQEVLLNMMVVWNGKASLGSFQLLYKNAPDINAEVLHSMNLVLIQTR